MTERRTSSHDAVDWDSREDSYREEEVAEEYDLMLPENPRMTDIQKVARMRGDSALLRNRPAMKRAIHNVHLYRAEKRIRKKILHDLDVNGGSIGMVSLFERIVEEEGDESINSAIGLLYVMQAEGRVMIDFEMTDYDFELLGERHQFEDEQIVVRLIQKTQAK